MRKKYWPILFGVGLLLVDQVIKWWVLKHPLFIVENSGLVFGYGPTMDLVFWISFGLILILALFTIETPSKHIFALSLMLAGIIGNLIDRVFRGAVIDYIRVASGIKYVFNFADLILIAGVLIYAYQVFRDRERGTDSKRGLRLSAMSIKRQERHKNKVRRSNRQKNTD